MKRAHMIVSGRVQGVGFRATAAEIARRFSVNGWVKNNTDGNVELEAEGSEEKVTKFVEEIKKGPNPFVKVDNAEVTYYDDTKEYPAFDIR